MAVVGDRITVASKGSPRQGVVTAVSGAMITVQWDTGGATSLIPGPGVVTVVTSRPQTLPARSRPRILGAVARKTKAAAGKKRAVKKAAAGKKRVVKKAASSSRTTRNKTR